MSVQELNFYWSHSDKAMVVAKEQDRVKFLIRHGMSGEEEFKLDRNQAHLLMLWLQEHLAVSSNRSAANKDFWK